MLSTCVLENLPQPMLVLLLPSKIEICNDVLMRITIIFLSYKKSKMNISPNPIEPRSIFTTQNITKGLASDSDRVLLEHTPIRYHEVFFTHTVCTTPIKQCKQASKSIEMPHKEMEISTFMHHTILSVNGITDSLHAWSQNQPYGGF